MSKHWWAFYCDMDDGSGGIGLPFYGTEEQATAKRDLHDRYARRMHGHLEFTITMEMETDTELINFLNELYHGIPQ